MSDSWTPPPLDIPPAKMRNAAGRLILSDTEYNRRWFARLMSRTAYNEKGCFVWQGPLSRKGYIMFSHRKWKAQAHRVVYMLTNGVELTTEQQVCHKCDERRCWNPAHLFVGSNQENCQDMAAKKRHQNNKKTHCAKGHEFTPENTEVRIDSRGWKHRTCVTCDRERMRRKWHENAEWRARQTELRKVRRETLKGLRSPTSGDKP